MPGQAIDPKTGAIWGLVEGQVWEAYARDGLLHLHRLTPWRNPVRFWRAMSALIGP